MSLEMLPWVAGFILAGVVLKVIIDQLMIRYGITPQDPDEQSRGFRDVLSRYRTWLEKRRHGDNSSD